MVTGDTCSQQAMFGQVVSDEPVVAPALDQYSITAMARERENAGVPFGDIASHKTHRPIKVEQKYDRYKHCL